MQLQGSLFNRLMEGPSKVAPAPGMGCTMLMYSDRRAYTVLSASQGGHSAIIQRDKVRRLDNLGMTDSGQRWSFEPDPDGETLKITLRKDGVWRVVGSRHTTVLIGERDEYYDYSF